MCVKWVACRVAVAYFAAVVAASEVVESRTEFERNWVVVAIAAVVVVATAFAIAVVGFVDMGLVVVASFIPLLQRNAIHYQFRVYI